MPPRPVLFRYKTNRLLNINVNIVLADVVSTAATALIVEAIQARLPTPLAIVTVTAMIDGAISLVVFAGLHSYANKTRGMKDLLRVQLHRWALSPLHYLVGAGLQYALLAAGVRTGIGVLIAYLSAVAIVRTIHTLYGKKSGLFH
jgi:voltage-gated potassium channel Kch